jgi:hypothetical protein
MKDLLLLLAHLLTTIAKLPGPVGTRVIVADSLLMKQQILSSIAPGDAHPTARRSIGSCSNSGRRFSANLTRLAIIRGIPGKDRCRPRVAQEITDLVLRAAGASGILPSRETCTSLRIVRTANAQDRTHSACGPAPEHRMHVINCNRNITSDLGKFLTTPDATTQ